jgi:hypothetical protein
MMKQYSEDGHDYNCDWNTSDLEGGIVNEDCEGWLNHMAFNNKDMSSATCFDFIIKLSSGTVWTQFKQLNCWS